MSDGISNFSNVNSNIPVNNPENTENRQQINNDENKVTGVLSLIGQDRKIFEDIKLQNGEQISPAKYNEEMDKLTGITIHDKDFDKTQTLNKNYASVNKFYQTIFSQHANATSKMFRRVFISAKESQFSSRSVADRAPHVLNMQKTALDVDANFLSKLQAKKYFYWLGADPNAYVEMYNLAENHAQHAFLDLYTAKFTGEQLANLTGNKAFGEASQVALAELLASPDKESIDNAYKEIVLLNDTLRKDVTDEKILKRLAEFESDFKTIAERKKQFIDEIEEKHKQIKLDENGKSSVKDADPSKYSIVHYSIDDSKNSKFNVPAHCGISSVLLQKENADKVNQIHKYNNDLLKINTLYKELKIAFKGETLKSTSYDFLAEKLRQNELKNDKLDQMLADHSKEVKESLLKKIEGTISSKITGPELAPALTEIVRTAQHSLSPADRNEVTGKLLTALSELKETDNLKGKDFKTLKLIADAILQDESLQPAFPVILGALEKSDFDTNAFSKLAIQLGKPEHTEFKDKVADFVKLMNEAVTDKTRTVDFMNRLISTSEDLKDTIELTLGILEQFHYMDPALCSHTHEAYFAKNVVISYIEGLPKEVVDNLFEKAHTAKDEDDINPSEKALYKIVTRPFSEITSSDYKDVINYIDTLPKLSVIEPIWQVFLNGGWQHTVIESDEQDKSMMPVTASNVAVHETVSGEFLYGNPELRDKYLKELIDKNPINANRLQGTKQGLVHKAETWSMLSDLHKALNDKFSSSHVYGSVMNSTEQGKSYLALEQLREEAIHLQGKGLVRISYAEKSPEEIISLKIAKPTSLIYNYAQHFGEYNEKTAAQTQEIKNPSVEMVLEANKAELKAQGKTIPDDKTILKNCTKVAASIKLLGDNLVDDLYTYNNANLERFGMTNVEDMRIDKETADRIKQANELLIKKNVGAISEEDYQQKVKELNLDEANLQVETALKALTGNIRKLGTSSPLSRIGELLVNKYAQLFALKNGADLAMVQASSEMTDKLMSDKRYLNEDEYNKSPQIGPGGKPLTYAEFVSFREEEHQLQSKVQYAQVYNSYSKVFDGDLSVLKNDGNLFANAIVNEMMVQCDLNSNMEKAIFDSFSRPVLSDNEKRLLVHKMNDSHKTVNLDTLSDSSKPNLDFNDSITSLIRSSNEDFSSKLNEFINTELTAERQLNAYCVILSHSHNVQDVAEVDELLPQEKMIGSKPSKTLQNIFSQQRDALLNQVQHSQQTDSELKRISAQIAPNVNNIYNDSSIHTYLRFAGCYAATKMGYSGSQELFNSYHKMSVEDQKKAMDMMMQVLVKQNFDPGLARALIERRLTDTNSNSLINTIIRSIRRAIFGGRQITDEQAIKEKEAKLAGTIPAVKEFIGSISKSKVLSVNKDWVFGFDPMNPIHKFILGKDDLPVKLSAALAMIGTSGMTFSRDKSGRMHIHADLTKLVGVKLNLGAKYNKFGVQGSGELKGGVEWQRVADLAFEDDAAAVVFISKMLCNQLTADDVNTALNLALGKKVKVNTGLSIAFGAAPFTGLLSAPEAPEDLGLLGTVVGMAGSVGVDMIDNLNFGRVGGSLEYNYATSSVEGIEGTTETTTHQFTFTGEFTPIHGGAYDEMLHTAGQVGAPEVVKLVNNFAGGDLKSEEEYIKKIENAGKEFEKTKTKKVKDILYKTNVVHYPLSSVDPKIPDGATNTFSASRLTKAHIDIMRKNGLISEENIKKFEQFLADNRSDEIGPVHTVFKLKQSAVLEMKAHPEKVQKILRDDDNYEFDRLDIETPTEGYSEEHGFAKLINLLSVIGVVSSAKSTARGTPLLSFKAGVMQ